MTDAMDLLYDRLDDLCLNGRFEEADLVLTQTDVTATPLRELVGLLTASLSWSSHLPSRSHFFQNVSARLATELPLSRVREILNGLE